MNTNCIVDHEGYSTIKGVEHYMLCKDGLYRGNEKDPKNSWEKVKNPFDVELDGISEVRDFLEAFDFYPDHDNDYLFYYDFSKDRKCDEFSEVDLMIVSNNTIYVALENPETKKFMIVPCTHCVHDTSDEMDPDDCDSHSDSPNICIIENTKRDITDDIVAYDNKTGNHVVFVGVSDLSPSDSDYSSVSTISHIVDIFKIERIADFRYRDDIDLYETISHWFSEKPSTKSKSAKPVNTSGDYTYITYGSISVTPNPGDKEVRIYRIFTSNTKRGDHAVFYVSYKNPGDEYITLYQVNSEYGFKKLTECYSLIESLKAEEIEKTYYGRDYEESSHECV